MTQSLPVISLFSGGGGLDLGVENCVEEGHNPFRVAVATDFDEDAVAAFRLNHDAPCIQDDIRTIPTEAILEAGGMSKGDPVLVVGGPPCTPFSKSGFWLDYKRESRDPNASLLDEFVRVVDEARPEAFILENVQGLTYRTHKKQFQRLLTQCAELGYTPGWKVLNAADYGVPQLRKRVFIIGFRDGRRPRVPAQTHSGWTEHTRDFDESLVPYVTAGDVLTDLLPGTPEEDEVVDGEYGELAASIPPGENYLWHTERKGGQDVFEWRSRYWTFLLKLTPDRPATTLQAQPGPWVGPFHWENVSNADGTPRARRLRVPEIKRLMTFPDNFRLPDGFNRRQTQKVLGNAVPVHLAAVVAQSVASQLGYLETDETVDLQSTLPLAEAS